MADNAPTALEQELLGIRRLLWGSDVKADVFKRWSQGEGDVQLFPCELSDGRVAGFYFSESEKSALEQLEGGPCAVIAPVQAFIIKNLLVEYDGFAFREVVSVRAVVDCISMCW